MKIPPQNLSVVAIRLAYRKVRLQRLVVEET